MHYVYNLLRRLVGLPAKPRDTDAILGPLAKIHRELNEAAEINKQGAQNARLRANELHARAQRRDAAAATQVEKAANLAKFV